MKWLIPICLAVLASCQNPNQERDQTYYGMCPPGNACLSPYFAVNRLKRNLYVKYDSHKHRFVETPATDKDAILVQPDNLVDFWRIPQYVVATPGPRGIQPDRIFRPGTPKPTPGAFNPG